VLEDHADLAEGLLALYQVTGDEAWFVTAGQVVEGILGQFTDGQGGFFDTSASAPRLVRRPRDPSDGVTPAGASASAHVLLTIGALTAEPNYLRAADAALATLMPVAASAPRFAGWTLATAAARLAGPMQVAVVLPQAHHGDPPEGTAPRTVDGLGELHRVALASTSPGLVVAVGEEGGSAVPLLLGRPAVGGAPTAYPCRGFVCDLPVTEPDALGRALGPTPDEAPAAPP
jgi:hypothetical protein